MKLEFDTLKYVRILKEQNFNPKDAEILITTLTEIDIRNLYDKIEVETMQNEMLTKTIEAHDKAIETQNRAIDKAMEAREKAIEAQNKAIEMRQHESDKALELRRHEFDQRCAVMEKRIESQLAFELAESRTNRRWIVGTIITVGFALAGYMSALTHFSH